MPTGNATWIIEEGHLVIVKKTAEGYPSLLPRERLIYCLWAADYGMRNAGDLTAAADVHSAFLRDGKAAAQELGLPHSTAAFSLSQRELEDRYFGLFDDIVAEIRAAWRSSADAPMA